MSTSVQDCSPQRRPKRPTGVKRLFSYTDTDGTDRQDTPPATLLSSPSMPSRTDAGGRHRSMAAVIAAREHTFAQANMRSLDYESRNERRDAIEDHYHGTYEWIFDAGWKDEGYQSDERVSSQARNDVPGRFQQWLTGDAGVYWVRGQPGSGKSTFMKFLSEHENTETMLQQWAADSKLLILDHYFWAPGSRLQKSALGMLRSVVYQLLSASPDLAEEAVLHLLDSQSPWHRARMTELSRDDLVGVLRALVQTKDLKLCLFLDGLDECDVDDQDDLIHDIYQLANMDGIKICVSSRQEARFEQAFDFDTPHLSLQDLTRSDISRYVKKTLRAAAPNQAEATSKLSKHISDKSNGVFLWTSIALGKAYRPLLEGATIAEATRYVTDMPSSLEEYLERQIHETITRASPDGSSRHSATAMALHIALAGADADHKYTPTREGMGSNTSFVYQWLLQKSVKERRGISVDPEYGAHMPFHFCSTEDLKQRVMDTHIFLTDRCQDLLQVGQPLGDTKHQITAYNVERLDYVFHLNVVSFRHRMVYDFLNTRRMRQLIHDHVPTHFHKEDFWDRQMTLARMRIIPPHRGSTWDYIFNRVYRYLAPLRSRYEEDISYGFEDLLVEALERFGSHLTTITPKDMKATAQLLTMFVERGHYRFASKFVAQVPSVVRSTNRDGHQLLAVALGMGAREFGIQVINAAFVNQLLQSGADPSSPSDGFEATSRIPGQPIWNKFFLKVWQEDPSSQNGDLSTSEQSCQLLTSLLKAQAEKDAKICTAPGACHFWDHGMSSHCTSDFCTGHESHQWIRESDVLRPALREDLVIRTGDVRRPVRAALQLLTQLEGRGFASPDSAGAITGKRPAHLTHGRFDSACFVDDYE